VSLDEDAVRRARSAIQDADSVVAFTGAGVSTASGIPSFRGEGGIWTKFDPDDFRYERFLDDPEGFWELRAELTRELALDEAEPNACHNALADAYEAGRLAAVVTQNIDGLHQAAGVPDEDVVEIHGSTRRTRCIDCSATAPIEDALTRIDEGEVPPTCPACGGVVKPDVVLFGERLPQQAFRRAERLTGEADVMLVAGSSLTVWPAAGLPERTLADGGELVVVNTEATKVDAKARAAIRGPVEDAVPQLFDVDEAAPVDR
jgi:NAD-dependent deacetylase